MGPMTETIPPQMPHGDDPAPGEQSPSSTDSGSFRNDRGERALDGAAFSSFSGLPHRFSKMFAKAIRPLRLLTLTWSSVFSASAGGKRLSEGAANEAAPKKGKIS
jgi:hypothetical protein